MALSDDVHFGDDNDIDTAAQALLARWTKKPAEQTEQAPVDEEVNDQEDETLEHNEGEEEDREQPEGEDEEEEVEEKTSARVAADEDEIEVKVGDDTHKVKVADLKRLYGQEASLTKKSQAVAEAEKVATEASQRHITAMNKLVERAQARFEPFKQIDWVKAQADLASGEITKEQFDQARFLATQAETEVKFYEQELKGHVEQAAKAEHEELVRQAAEANKVLSDTTSDYHVPGWGGDLYKEMRTYALGAGIDQQAFDRLVSPAAIKIIHKAMLHDKATKTATKKLVNAPKNVNKTPTNGASSQPGEAAARKSLDRLRRTGTIEDAAAALEARWKLQDAE